MCRKAVRKAATTVESAVLTTQMVNHPVNSKHFVKRKRIQKSVLDVDVRRRIEGNRIEVSQHGRTAFTQMADS
jgi:hypothetical protein